MSRHSSGTDRSLVSALRAKVDDAAADVYDLHAEARFGYVCGFVDRAPADKDVPSPSDATLRLDLGDYPRDTTAPVTTTPATPVPDTGTTTTAPDAVTTTEATVTETSASESTATDPSSTTAITPTTTETEWSSRRDRSRDGDSDDSESEPTDTDESSGGGNSGGSAATDTAPPLFTFEPGPFGLSGE